MPATLIWGKGFRLVDDTDPLGKVCTDVIGIEGGFEFLSWSSVAEISALAEEYGVNRAIWPVYPDCEVPDDVSLDDAEKRSAALRTALDGVPHGVVEQDDWLKVIVKLLRDGNAFFVMVLKTYRKITPKIPTRKKTRPTLAGCPAAHEEIMERTSVVVWRAVRAKQLSEALSIEVEKRGEAAFQQISTILTHEVLPGRSKINALRLLSQITRHFYMEGKPEVIRLAAELANDNSENVRSTACLVAIYTLETLEHLARLEQHVDFARESTRDAISKALRGGVDPKTRELAMQVARSRGWDCTNIPTEVAG